MAFVCSWSTLLVFPSLLRLVPSDMREREMHRNVRTVSKRAERERESVEEMEETKKEREREKGRKRETVWIKRSYVSALRL